MHLDGTEKDAILKCYLWFHLIEKHTTHRTKLTTRTHMTGPETGVPGVNHRQSAVRRRREFKGSWEEDNVLFIHWNPYLRRVRIFIAVWQVPLSKENVYWTKACWEAEIAEFYVCVTVIFCWILLWPGTSLCVLEGRCTDIVRRNDERIKEIITMYHEWYSKTEDKQVWLVENYLREWDHHPWWLSLMWVRKRFQLFVYC